MFSPNEQALIRSSFPQLEHDCGLIYLDTAATALRLGSCLERLNGFYRLGNATVSRALYPAAREATAAVHHTRVRLADLLHVPEIEQVIFTRGTTDSINMLARAVAAQLRPGDEVLVTAQEHHSNLVPWQMACASSGATLRILPLTATGEWDCEQLPKLLTPACKLVACSLVSNVLGVRNPVEHLVQAAHSVGARVVCDAAQAVATHLIKWSELGVDALAFSAHKLFGPTGVGALIGDLAWLDSLPVPAGGGDMVDEVWTDHATYAALPHRWEAGTPAIAEIIAWAEAIDWVKGMGPERIGAHCRMLLREFIPMLEQLGFVVLDACNRGRSLISCTHPHAHAADIATLLGLRGIAVRSGHLCAQPLLRHLGYRQLLRCSFGPYTTSQCLMRACQELESVIDIVRQ